MQMNKKTPIGVLRASYIPEENGQGRPGLYVDLWGNEREYPKHLQPLCRVEYVDEDKVIRVSVYADGDERQPVNVTDIPVNKSLIGVRYEDKGILVDKDGNRYICDCDGCGAVMSESTGELFHVYCRTLDERALPACIGPFKS